MNNIFVSTVEIRRQKEIADQVRKMTVGKKAHIQTFGCQQNEADSERIAGSLRLCGYTMTEDRDGADLIILNTCAVREHAELKILSVTGQLKKLKEQNRDLLIGIGGCMTQLEVRRAQIKKSYPYVSFLFGTDMHHRLPEILFTALSAKKRNFFVNEKPHFEFGVISEDVPVDRDSTYKAWVSIMYGCDNFCSYCIVPHVRGRERSRDYDAIMEEIKELVAKGYKDITLLGQNVNSYKGKTSFAGLLKDIADIPGDFWVRFMTSHPKDASSELIDVIADNPKIARHFHLPFQAGNDRVLSVMNRKYTKEQYIKRALEIKEKIAGVSLTTDIICGFPTESEKEFEDTLEVVEAVGFDMIYTFLYSPRSGTPAAKMEDHIPHEEKVRRFQQITALQNEISLKTNQGYVGQTVRVLSEGFTGKTYSGRTTQNKIVSFDTPVKEGVFVDILIEKAFPYALYGEVAQP